MSAFVYNPEIFLNFLRNEFQVRASKNQRYSLRAFARSLEFNPGCLSVILRGSRPLTQRLMKKIIRRLSLDPNVLFGREGELYPTKKISLGLLSIFSHWYYDAILELFKIPDFNANPESISKALEISETEVQIAMEHLIANGFLSERVTENSLELKLEIPNSDLELDELTSSAAKNFQKEILSKSSRAIDEVEFGGRYHSSDTVAICSEDLDEFKRLLRKFRQKLKHKLQNRPHKLNQVYVLNLGMFPVSKLNQNKGEK